MKGRKIPYTKAELAWLSDNRTMPISDYHSAFCKRFGRDDVSKRNLHSLRKRNGWKTGRTGQFVKGQEPHNKGKKCPEGVGGRHPNARRTQFKKGQTPHNTNYLGHERVSRDGYVEVSVAETNPHTGYERRYVHKHRHEWEKVNGPVPEGHALKCLDGDRQNTVPSNWKLIPRGVLARLNGGRFRKTLAYDDAAPEVKPSVMALAELKHELTERRKAQ
ncbi:HNH endonuclease signature motif containing protein [Parasphingorhabdus sp. JC815]|uniref:HNH endonuclease signature motif containing protein n=1 Tax=Parasphingorhabdus sp. JC815 TaxID=3232140 RepID=UPI003458AA3F